MRGRKEGGRYTVGDKQFASRLAALAAAMHRTTQDGATRYVREIGKQGSLYIVQREGRDTVYVMGGAA